MITVVDPVGIVEIAERLGVRQQTVSMWRYRELGFPDPVCQVGGRPCWAYATVKEWAEQTDRM